MAEYIDRNGLIEALNKFAPEHYNALINQLITKYPTADVVPKSEIEQKDIEIDILIRKKETLKDEVAELRAEVENLTIELQAMRGAANSYKAEVERLEEMLDSAVSSERNVIDNIPYERAEAIRELNAKLYAYKTDIFIKGEELMIIPMSDYDEILKEMVGDSNV